MKPNEHRIPRAGALGYGRIPVYIAHAVLVDTAIIAAGTHRGALYIPGFWQNYTA